MSGVREMNMLNIAHDMVKYSVALLGLGVVGCAGEQFETDHDIQPNPPVVQAPPNVTPSLPGNAPETGAYGEQCNYRADGKLYAYHQFPGQSAANIAKHVVAYPALDIPVSVEVPLVSDGFAWYDCGNSTTGYAIIVFAWSE
jgi:hypothetical protein